MKNLFLSILALSVSSSTFAADLKVEMKEMSFKVYEISAEKVKGVKLVLTADIERDDCNKRTIGDLEMNRVQGNEDGFWSTRFVNANISSTEMFCPLNKVIKETIRSKPLFVGSLNNEFSDGVVEYLKIIVPAQMNLEVTEVKK